MVVITATDIDYGLIFGPFPSYLTTTDPAYIIGLLTSDKHPQGVVLKVDTTERHGGLQAVDWLPYVSSARDEDEQNMEAYAKEGCIFYRTLRIVRAGEELLVWYSKDFTQLLGVPELQTNSKRDDEQFICSHCGEMFDFPYPLRAHLKFRCSFRADDNIKYRIQGQHSPSMTVAMELYNNARKTSTNDHISHISSLQPNGCLSNINNNNDSIHIISSRATKRPSDDLESSPSPKKTANVSEKSPRKLSHSIEELSKSHTSKDKENPIHDKPLGLQTENVSAFRKVEKSNKSPDRLPSPSEYVSSSKTLSPKLMTSVSPVYTSLPQSSSTIGGPHTIAVHQTSPLPRTPTPEDEPSTSSMLPPSRPPLKSMASTVSHSDPTLPSSSLMNMYLPRMPLLPPATSMGLSRGNMINPSLRTPPNRNTLSLPHLAVSDQIPPGLLEMCRATIPTVGPLTESFASNIRNMDFHVQETIAKRALFADRHISSLGFLKSQNPMVEKLLQTTNPTLLSSPINALNLSQNWCAKCNATFRMTSDLVYHMRSHHKREFDPMKRKREEKLKCTICNETFRERHHLTRHMSSHA